MELLSAFGVYVWFVVRITIWVISGMAVLTLVLQVIVGPFLKQLIADFTESVSTSACNVIRFYYTERYEFVKRCASDEDHLT